MYANFHFRQLVLLVCINSALIVSPPAQTINKMPLKSGPEIFISGIDIIKSGPEIIKSGAHSEFWGVASRVPSLQVTLSIAEKCFDIWGILKMASVKSVESGNNYFSVNHIIRCRSKFLPLGFSKFVLVLIL